MTDFTSVSVDEGIGDPAGDGRHLRLTIAALRRALEDAEVERHDERQQSRATYEGKITELHATIAALRDALERSRLEGQSAVERATAVSNDEIAQLRLTIQALRDQIEAQRHEHREAIQRLSVGAHGEADELRGTVRALRERLEHAESQFELLKQAAAVTKVTDAAPASQALRDARNGSEGIAQ